jgi:hypothetical protein
MYWGGGDIGDGSDVSADIRDLRHDGNLNVEDPEGGSRAAPTNRALRTRPTIVVAFASSAMIAVASAGSTGGKYHPRPAVGALRTCGTEEDSPQCQNGPTRR